MTIDCTRACLMKIEYFIYFFFINLYVINLIGKVKVGFFAKHLLNLFFKCSVLFQLFEKLFLSFGI